MDSGFSLALPFHGYLWCCGFSHFLFSGSFSGTLWLWVEILVPGVISWNKCPGSPGTTWVELLVLEPRLGKILWSPSWVEILVPRVGLEKFSGALECCGLNY